MNDDEMDPELDDNNSESLTQEQSSSRSSRSSSLKNNIQKRLSKASAKNAAKQSLVKALTPVLTYVLVFIIILIIIIGIAMFLITMPGMVMDQIKTFARDVGNAVASWFGADTTKQVADVDIYETLDYLEQMGYDLKGDGFLTDYVGDYNDGVERDENDKIINAKSDFISNYLVSDNYVYTIKNFNMDNANWFTGMLSHLASLFTLGSANQYWSRGMIDIRHDSGVIGHMGKYYSVYEAGSIKIDTEAKTLDIKRGWFNNTMSYNLDGWTGRYGMPIDFLLSVHLATMMPDLAYDMATGFDTKIDLLLHAVGGGEEEENTAVGYYKLPDGSYKSYGDFADTATSGFTGALNTWRVSKKEAMTIMKEFGIKSPNNCTGAEAVGVDPIVPASEDQVESKQISLEGSNASDDIKSTYNNMINTLKEYGFTEQDATNAGIPMQISNLAKFKDMLEEVPNQNSDETWTYEYEDTSGTLSKVISWTSNNSDYSTYIAEIDLNYDNYTKYQTNNPGERVTVNAAVINYKITGEWSEEREEAWLEENQVETTEDAKCSQQPDKDKCCGACRKYIQKIYDYIKKADVSDLDIYQPYISKVTNHWYRDVYFVADTLDQQFVDYDYDYESIMKERWTLYETYGDENPEKEGEYKLYEIDADGEYKDLYDGTAEEASKNGVKVAKKAITQSIADMADDLNWNNVNGVLAAYSLDQNSQTEFQPVYPNITEKDKDYDIKKDVYVNIITTGNITQTGEGQRTETNPKIKKMFLQNRYLRYDGSSKTAEIITTLRKSISSEGYLGPVKSEDVDYTDVTAEVDGETYKVEDYSGEVSLNQDSLNAFSMLENEHTLDADYIYRDFKELIVELGYFKKEELTDETPRLLQFLVPEIGSYGYPNRAIDKNEHEYGTMIHSKGDIDANQRATLTNIIAQVIASTTDEEEKGIDENIPENTTNPEQNDVDTPNQDSNTDGVTVVQGMNEHNSSSSDLLSLEDWWKELDLMMEEFKVNRWTYAQSHSAGSFEQAKESGPHTVDCSLFASWALQKLGVLQEGQVFSSGLATENGIDGENADISQAIMNSASEIIMVNGPINSEDKLQPGDVIFYTGHVSIYYGEGKCYDAGAEYWNQGKEEPVTYNSLLTRHCKLILRFPFGSGSSSSSGGKSYQGYEGNEAVVSPVTGILLEYGTYDDEIDSVTGEEYRVNVDLKYGTGLLQNVEQNTTDDKASENNNGNDSQSNLENTNDENDNDNKNNDSTRLQGETQIDKVGYAKILVLDKENYQKLEKAMIGSTRWSSSDSFLSDSGSYKSRDLKNLSEEEINSEDNPWSDVDRTLYGYKEFAEMYEEYGIAGHVIYIDGFKCELPAEQTQSTEGQENEPNDDEPNTLTGEEIKSQYFEKVTLSNFDAQGNIIDEEQLLDSLYEKDEEFKMASKRATAKLNAENLVKDEAVSSLYIDGLKIIKEGTVIGRTITDEELIVDYRGKNYEDYRTGGNSSSNNNNENDDVQNPTDLNQPETPNEENSKPNENNDKVIGNYIRIIMRDLDKTVVENVEDYMKLDEDGSGNQVQADHFSVVWTVLSEDEWVQKALAYTANHGDDTFKSEANLRELYNICKDKQVNPEFIFVRGIQESSLNPSNHNNYWGYNTPNGKALWDGGTWQNVLDKYCDSILDYQKPSSSHYEAIMARYEERKACTENGGIDPLGYGLPSSVSGLQSRYSWIGDDHSANSAGGGGMYYLYPWGWCGPNEYTGENKIIFENQAEFEQLCGSRHGTSGGKTSNTPTTIWEQGMYTAYQAKKIINPAKEIFGELAGTHDP